MAKEERKLNVTEWAEAEDLYARGLASLSDLAEKFGCNKSTISRHMVSAGIVKGSRAGETAVEAKEAVAEKMKEDAKLLAKRIHDIKNDTYTRNDAIAKLTMMEIAKAKNDGLPYAAIAPNLKALLTATNIINKVWRGSAEALGIFDENSLPAEIPDLTFTIVDDELIRQRVEENARALAVDDEDIDLSEGEEDEDEVVVEEGLE